jgi:DENN (AEX-3) domain
LYGIALRVWSRADEKRAETIRDLRKRTEPDFYDNGDETYWIPYCLSFLSRYPLYNLLGDYLRGMWIHWNKATNLFHAEEVSRILSFPAPRLNDLVRIDMKDYALCYQFPSSPTGFQNFAMWPLFTCLSIPNIVGVIEAAVSPTRRIIFVSHYPAILTVAAEAVRFCVRVYEWSGLYVPVVHARHVKDLVQEPGPYILGVTAECRTLFTAPTDALVVDLDRNFVLTSSPPSAFTSGQRTKMINRLSQALNGDMTPTGVPQHLRSAYGGGKLVPAGQIIVMRGEVESINDPEWWNQDAVMSVMDHVCEKLGRNSGIKAIFGGSQKKPLMTKVSMRHLNEIVRERNQYSRDAMEAWQDFINLKSRMDMELTKVTKRNNFLVEELENLRQQFLKFQAFAEQLTKETQDLKVKIDAHKREHRRLSNLVDQQKDDATRLASRLSGTEKQRDDALEALVLQQEIAEELERERKRNKKELAAMQHTSETLTRQRDEAQRVVLHLRALIDGQAHHMEHIVKSLSAAPELSEYIEEGFEDEDDVEDEEELAEGEEAHVQEEEDDEVVSVPKRTVKPKRFSLSNGRSFSRASTVDTKHLDGEDVTPDMEDRLHNHNPALGNRNRMSTLSMADVADRHLRDKTDAIAYIIRNISEQCAAAVEGLELARSSADTDDEASNAGMEDTNRSGGKSPAGTMGASASVSAKASRNSLRRHIKHDRQFSAATASSSHAGSEFGDDQSSVVSDSVYLNPNRDSRASPVPPTPDLVGGRRISQYSNTRSGTSMSMTSASTTPERHSLQHYPRESDLDVPARVVEADEDVEGLHRGGDIDEESARGVKYGAEVRKGKAVANVVEISRPVVN